MPWGDLKVMNRLHAVGGEPFPKLCKEVFEALVQGVKDRGGEMRGGEVGEEELLKHGGCADQQDSQGVWAVGGMEGGGHFLVVPSQ